MANKLKEKREQLKLTQREVGALANIPYQAYQRYENYGVLPNVKIALRIAKALKTTVEELYGEDDKENKTYTKKVYSHRQKKWLDKEIPQ